MTETIEGRTYAVPPPRADRRARWCTSRGHANVPATGVVITRDADTGRCLSTRPACAVCVEAAEAVRRARTTARRGARRPQQAGGGQSRRGGVGS